MVDGQRRKVTIRLGIIIRIISLMVIWQERERERVVSVGNSLGTESMQ